MEPTQDNTTVRSGKKRLRDDAPETVFGIAWVHPRIVFTPLTKSIMVLGRDLSCDVRLPGSETSRQHARLVRQGSAHVIQDLGSTNGVRVNGQLTSEHTLDEQEVVRLGDWVGVATRCPVGSNEFLAVPRRGVRFGPRMQTVLRQAKQVSKSDIPIILLGETGTGKEVLARSIHEMSQRTGNYVATNCAALPDTLAEAQLFGHRKGAFTGADRAAPGFFRSAHEGTLLLDEIGDLSPPAQAKVLRAIEERAIVPLGEAMPVPVDVRLIAAGQNDLRASVERGEFRGDLFARLNGLELRLPPLRERREEIVPIFKSVLEEHFAEPPQLDSAVVEKLCIYAWPFNVREVVQTARSVAALHPQAAELTSDLLPRSVTEGRSDKQSKSARPPTSRRAQMKMRDREQLRELVNALNTHGGNVARAAKAVGISRQRAYRLIEGSPDVDLDRVRSEMREKPDAPVDG